MNAATLNTYTCTNRVDTLIECFNSNLSTLSRKTGDTADCNQTVCNLRNLSLQQALQEDWSSTAQDNLWIIVLVVYTKDDRTNSLTLAVSITRNLLSLRQHELVVLIIYNQNLALPNLINLTRDNLTYAILVFVVE